MSLFPHKTPFCSLSYPLVLSCALGALCAVTAGSLEAKPQVRSGPLRMERLTAPDEITLPLKASACRAFIRRYTQRPSRRYPSHPTSEKKALRLLKKAKSTGRLHLEQGAIMARIQLEIDRHKGGNLYLLFGNDHTIPLHYRFFNEILHPGRDGIALEGLTHLALESYVTSRKPRKLSRRTRRLLRRLWGSKGSRYNRGSQRSRHSRRYRPLSKKDRLRLARLLLSDQQSLLDLYHRHGASWALRALEVLNHFFFSRNYPPSFLYEVQATLGYARRYNKKRGVPIIATDISLKVRRALRRLPRRTMVYPIREIFSFLALQRHLPKNKTNIIAYMWGANHVRKKNFPRFVPTKDRVYSIRLLGGGRPDHWDRAARTMGLQNRLFALETPGAEEGDLLIHFPPQQAMVALRTKGQGPVPHGRIYRSLKGIRFKPPPLDRSYAAAVTTALGFENRRLARCYRGARRWARVRLQIDGNGRIRKIRLEHRSSHNPGWSLACIQRILWRLPLPPPPHHKPIEVLFRIRYQHPHKKKQR